MFIRNQKRKTIVAGIVGAAIVMVPAGMCTGYSVYQEQKWKGKCESIVGNQESERVVTVCVLNCDKKKGEAITDNEFSIAYLKTGDDISCPEPGAVSGKILNQDVQQGQILTEPMLHEDEGFYDDVRLHEFTDITINANVVEGSYIDIRISFPDGEDYIVAQHKRVEAVGENSLCLYVTEEEILKMSSAAVDVNEYQGTKLYAIIYAADYQQSAIANYPANIEVCQLGDWDPNLVEKVFTNEVVQNRNSLDNNLLIYRDAAN